jgi:hypothetical protein
MMSFESRSYSHPSSAMWQQVNLAITLVIGGCAIYEGGSLGCIELLKNLRGGYGTTTWQEYTFRREEMGPTHKIPEMHYVTISAVIVPTATPVSRFKVYICLVPEKIISLAIESESEVGSYCNGDGIDPKK